MEHNQIKYGRRTKMQGLEYDLDLVSSMYDSIKQIKSRLERIKTEKQIDELEDDKWYRKLHCALTLDIAYFLKTTPCRRDDIIECECFSGEEDEEDEEDSDEEDEEDS